MPSVKGTSDLGRVIKFNVVCSLYSAWVHHHGAGARVLELHHPSYTVGASRIVQQNPYLLRYVGLWDMLHIIFYNILCWKLLHLDNSHCQLFLGFENKQFMQENHPPSWCGIRETRRQWTCSCPNVPLKPLLQFQFHFTFYNIIKIARTVVMWNKSNI